MAYVYNLLASDDANDATILKTTQPRFNRVAIELPRRGGPLFNVTTVVTGCGSLAAPTTFTAPTSAPKRRDEVTLKTGVERVPIAVPSWPPFKVQTLLNLYGYTPVWAVRMSPQLRIGGMPFFIVLSGAMMCLTPTSTSDSDNSLVFICDSCVSRY